MSKQFILTFALALMTTTAYVAGTTTAFAADPLLKTIDCTGSATDGRPAKISIVVAPTETTYPIAATANLQVGTDAPETLGITISMTSGKDVSTRTVYLINSTLDLDRVFAARTFDLQTGVGALKLSNTLRAAMLQCTFSTVTADAQPHPLF